MGKTWNIGTGRTGTTSRTEVSPVMLALPVQAALSAMPISERGLVNV